MWSTKGQGAAPSRRDPSQITSAGKVLAVRRIDVFKKADNPDLALRMELTTGDIYLVPIGPKLASVLVESLDRAIRALPAPASRQ